MDLIASGLLMIAASGSASSQVVWKWQPDAGVCALRQQLREPGSFIQFSMTPGKDRIAIAFQDRSAGIVSSKSFSGAILNFEPTGTTTVDGSIGPGELFRSRKVSVGMDAQEFLGAFSNATEVKLSHDEVGSLAVPVRSPAAAVQAIRDCEDKRLREWGIDPASWRALQSKPEPTSPVTKWFTPNDYPLLAAVYGIKALVVARLDVGADGMVQGCAIVHQRAHLERKEFEASTCEGLKRNARFRPALDANGNAVSAPFVIAVRFGDS